MTRAIAIAVLGAAALTGGAPATTGRVLSADTGDPIANARVVVTGNGASRLAITDTNGRFAVDAPPPFTIAAIKSGYLRRELGIRSSSDLLDIRLVKTAVVSGRVVDAMGEPVASVPIRVNRPAGDSGQPAELGRGETDDRGEFRVAGLPAARAIVEIATTNARGDGNARPTRLWFPDARTAADASVIVLVPGEEHADTDFVVGADQTGFAGALFFAAPGSAQRAARRGTSAIRGRVGSTDGRALGNALVRLYAATPPPIAQRSTRSDAAGRFEFVDLPAGRFKVTAAKTGYTAANSADFAIANLPLLGSGPWVEIGDDDSHEGVEITLAPLATVSGTVFDELGDPIQGASVQLLHVAYERGHRRLMPAGAARPTDDRGRYRIFDVRPGPYAVMASVGAVLSAQIPGYARSYFPGSGDPAAAQFVSVGAAQDVTGIDFGLQPAATARVAGRILDSSGQPTMVGTLQLRPFGSAALVGAATGASIGRDGTFEFANVAPGQYLIYADRGRQNGYIEGEFATMPVAVAGADLTGLTVQLSAGSTIAGRIVFDTAEAGRRPRGSALELSPLPIEPDTAPANIAHAEIAADGTFAMHGVNGPRRIELTRLPPDWMLRSVRVNGIDATDRPIAFGRRDQSLADVEIVLTDRVNVLAGIARDSDGRPAAGAHVIVSPIDRNARYAGSRFLRAAESADDGTYAISGLPPGSYYAAAVRSLPQGEDAWQDPGFLESLAAIAATVIVDGEGQRNTIDLRVR